jgi:subtilase family serine protease
MVEVEAGVAARGAGEVPAAGGTGGGGGTVTNPNPVSTALTPAQVSQAYGLGASSTTGSGMTIAIVDAYNDPNIQADLAKFDAQYNLPTANLTVENQYGQTTNLPSTDPSWSLEIALDVEWAHAAAPGAKILLVEANSATTTDLMTAVQTAAKSASVVAMSWGGSEFSGETAYDTAAYFANPNVTFVAASGDDGGASGAEWPASSPYVLSVGGTTLTLNSSGGYGSETAWSASGSRWSGYSGSAGGTSTVESLPSYQSAALGSSYAKGRTTPDVSLDGNPNAGFSVYDSVPGAGATGWFQVGGTSAGTPVWAGIVAAADAARAANHLAPLSSAGTLSLLYSLYGRTASPASTYATSFHDITSGANFAGKAGTGYDLVTGLGSPIASAIVSAASSYAAPSSVLKAAVATTTTTTTTHVTTHDVTAAVTTAAASTTSATVFVPIAPASTTAAAAQTAVASASASTATSTTGVTTSTAAARPVQPLSQPTARFDVSASEEAAPAWETEAPGRPGLFLDPVGPQEVGKAVPMLVGRPAPALPGQVWDAAVDDVLLDEGWFPATDLTPEPVPLETPGLEEGATAAGSAAAAGLAVVLWGTWQYRTSRSDRDRRRRPFHRPLSAV